MATLSIKNVPDEVVIRLRERAERNHRSMQGELMALIRAAVAESTGLAPAPDLSVPRSSWISGGSVPIEEIAREHATRWPEPFDRAPRSVDIIRGDRDAR